jgi:hypothetical protein
MLLSVIICKVGFQNIQMNIDFGAKSSSLNVNEWRRRRRRKGPKKEEEEDEEEEEEEKWAKK